MVTGGAAPRAPSALRPDADGKQAAGPRLRLPRPQNVPCRRAPVGGGGASPQRDLSTTAKGAEIIFFLRYPVPKKIPTFGPRNTALWPDALGFSTASSDTCPSGALLILWALSSKAKPFQCVLLFCIEFGFHLVLSAPLTEYVEQTFLLDLVQRTISAF